jgi:MFS transporter, DHA2 family, methylenomycin A resistance protein
MFDDAARDRAGDAGDGSAADGPGARGGDARFFVVALHAQVVNVTLPDIRARLGGALSGLQWVVTICTLMFSALLLFAGALSDRIGARRSYGGGMVLFVAASAACGLAPALPVLIGARLVQGVGAALVTPTSLALIREAYTDPTRRARSRCGRWAGRSRPPRARWWAVR